MGPASAQRCRHSVRHPKASDTRLAFTASPAPVFEAGTDLRVDHERAPCAPAAAVIFHDIRVRKTLRRNPKNRRLETALGQPETASRDVPNRENAGVWGSVPVRWRVGSFAPGSVGEQAAPLLLRRAWHRVFQSSWQPRRRIVRFVSPGHHGAGTRPIAACPALRNRPLVPTNQRVSIWSKVGRRRAKRAIPRESTRLRIDLLGR